MQRNQQLHTLVQELQANTEKAKSLLNGKPEAEIMKRPPKGGWSAVESIHHLTLTSELYLQRLPPVIEKARQNSLHGNGPFRMDFKGRLLKWVLEPPYSVMKVKTFASIDVHSPEQPKNVLRDFLSSQEKLYALYESANGLAIDKIMVTSPLNEKMSYNLFAAFSTIAAHQRRHLWQAEQALLARS